MRFNPHSTAEPQAATAAGFPNLPNLPAGSAWCHARILQNMKSCGWSVSRCHELPSPTAAGPGGGAGSAGGGAGGPAANPPKHAA